MSRASQTVCHLRADGLVLRQTVGLTQPDSLSMARGVSLHTKARKETQGQSAHGRLVKVDPTFDQLLSKYARTKVVLCDHQQRNPGHPLKQNDPKSDATSIAYSSCDVRMLSTRLLIIDILFCSNMEWYDNEPMVYAKSLRLFGLGAPPFYSF
jgi:hypothetical protein